MTLSESSEKLAKALLLPINPAVVVLLGIYTMLWGFWVANPFWSVFGTAALFSALENMWILQALSIPAEPFWGTIAIFCGAITTYGAYKRSYKPLIRGSTIIGWHWFMIAILYFMGDWHNTGGITALLMAIYGAFLYVNIRVNYKPRHEIKDVLNE